MSSIPDDPSILVIGLNGKEELNIIKGILNEPLPQHEFSDYLEKYKWFIDNKYYKAEIKVCKLKSDKILSSPIFNSCEAVIVYTDSSKLSAIDEVHELLDVIEEQHQIDIRLLVCDSFTDEDGSLTKEKAQGWCIDHGWELVELDVESTGSEHEDDLEDDFVDSWGFTRIKQALNAHTWSNLQLKDKKDGSFGSLFQKITLNDSENETPEVPYEKLDTSCNGIQENINCEGEDDFTTLFSSLGEMKQKAESLPLEERRIYAEKMAMAFLKSFGDDESECSFEESDDERN